MKTKEKILRCTLELAAQNGLGSVSLSMIAQKVGVRKATLFSHFASKEEIIRSLYEYLREASLSKQGTPVSYAERIVGKDAQTVLMQVVNSYIQLNAQKDMQDFYKFIYCERAINPAAAAIMRTEAQTMLAKTRALFDVMAQNGLLDFTGKRVALASTLFCLTIHELMDMERDNALCGVQSDPKALEQFVADFCSLYTEQKQEERE